MTKRTSLLMLLCVLACVMVLADSWRPRNRLEKVVEAELIVLGIATLEGLPLETTERPVERACRIVPLKTLWPTNEAITNMIVVTHWAWTKWPDTWWKYNSQTGLYFLERTSTALKRARANPRYGRGSIHDNVFGTNYWIPLSRFDDWYEPTTNMPAVQKLIKESKK